MNLLLTEMEKHDGISILVRTQACCCLASGEQMPCFVNANRKIADGDAASCCWQATNRPQELDEAMHRRITMAFEFRKPDHVQRQVPSLSLLQKCI